MIIKVRIPDHLDERFEKLSEEQGLTLGALAMMAIANHLEHVEKLKNQPEE